MGVSAGSPVSASNTNQAFLDANGDDTGIGVYTLNNTLAASGPQVDNIQREHNSIASFTGKATNSVKNDLPAWTNNQVGSSTDPLKLRSDLLTARFDGTTGHQHTGATGEGPQVTAPNIASVRLHGYFLRGTDLSAVTGTSSDVSTPLTGKTPSSSQTVKGVVVVAPNNKVVLQQATGVNQGAEIKDGSGNVVYGRVTESVGVWTLSYFVLLSGVETAYNFLVATDVAWFYQELFNPITDAPVYSELATIPSDNITADIVDASATQRGAVNTADQTFGGIKRFLNQLAIRDTSAAFDAVVAFVSSIALTAQRTFTIDLKNVSRTLTMSGDADISGTNSGDVTTAVIGSTPNANGASLTGQALTLQPADGTFGGVLTAIAQSIKGTKTFVDDAILSSMLNLNQSVDSTTNGTSQSITPTKSYLVVTNASLISINNFGSPLDGKTFIFKNGTGVSITLLNDIGGTAANRIVTGTGADLTLINKASVLISYDANASRWQVVGGSGSGGGGGSANFLLVKANGNAPSATAGNPIIFPTAAIDAGSNYNTSTGQLTCPFTGKIQVGGVMSASAATGGQVISIYKNGSLYDLAGIFNSNGGTEFSGLVDVTAGDILTLVPSITLDPSADSYAFFVSVAAPSGISYAWSGYQTIASGWDTTSNSTYADPNAGATISLTQLVNNNMGTVVTEASNLPGVTFTPPLPGMYEITATVPLDNTLASTATYGRLVDGASAIINSGSAMIAGGNGFFATVTLSGLLPVPTVTATTVKIQIATSGVSTSSVAATTLKPLSWTIKYVGSL